MKDFFAYSSQTTIDCDISVLDDGIIIAKNNCFRNMFYRCAELISLPEEFNLPQKLTSVGNYFAASMFYNCTSLRSPSSYETIIQIPADVFNATHFCYQMFYGITENITATSGTVASDGTPDPGSKITFKK